jgi:hypothetical protein
MPAAAITALVFAYLLVMVQVLGRKKPGYGLLRHTISELGERGARHERLVAFGLFLPIGLALLLVAGLTAGPVDGAIPALAACIAAGYLGAALFPCDPGSPMFGSARQHVHNLAGAVEYVGGGIALITIGDAFGHAFRIAGCFVLAAAIALCILPAKAGRGAVQWLAELCLFGGLCLASLASASKLS